MTSQHVKHCTLWHHNLLNIQWDDVTTCLTFDIMASQLVEHSMWWHHNVLNIGHDDIKTFLIWTWWHHNLFNIQHDDVTMCWTSVMMMSQFVEHPMWWRHNFRRDETKYCRFYDHNFWIYCSKNYFYGCNFPTVNTVNYSKVINFCKTKVTSMNYMGVPR